MVAKYDAGAKIDCKAIVVAVSGYPSVPLVDYRIVPIRQVIAAFET